VKRTFAVGNQRGLNERTTSTDRSERVDEDRFNISVRKFLKVVGVTSQREIESAVRAALSEGRIDASALDAVMTLEIPALGVRHVVDGRIEVGGDAGEAGERRDDESP
jgi:hypothetical protein